MDWLHAVLVAIIQGATELFPVSSLGHAVVLPALFQWRLDQHSDSFLPFLVLLHAGTSVALLAYFWKDWLAIGLGVIGVSGAHQTRESRRVFLLIVVATIPAVILGFALNKFFRTLFDSPMAAAAFLVVNGLLLLFGERVRGTGTRPLASLTAKDAFIIGCWQCLALIPGISRAGSTIVGGILRGISHEDSAHFSFLIALPVIVGATVLEVPKLLHAGLPSDVLSLAVVAAIVAGITAFLSTWFLMRYFRQHEKWALNPFGYYCIALGVVALGWLGFAA